MAGFASVEEAVLEQLAAADPRLARRTGAVASAKVLGKLGTSAVIAEDHDAILRGASLDIFSFHARVRALEAAQESLAKSTEVLPLDAPRGAAMGRPRLERELLARMLAEETERAKDEARVAIGASDLVRGIVVTWTPATATDEIAERDLWMEKRLGEMTVAIREQRTFSFDLQEALDPLERLLDPPQYPKGTSQMVELRAFRRVGGAGISPAKISPSQLDAAARAHLGVPSSDDSLDERLEATIVTLERQTRDLRAALGSESVGDELAKDAARALLATTACPVVADSRVRSAKPPPEREAICGALTLLDGAWATAERAAILMAMHDATVAAQAALHVGKARHEYLAHLESDAQAALETVVTARPLVPLGVALAAELLTRGSRDPAKMRERLTRWLAFGDAPLDVVERELLSGSRSSPSSPSLPTSPP